MATTYNLISCLSENESIYGILSPELEEYVDSTVVFSDLDGSYRVDLNEQFIFSIPNTIGVDYSLTISSYKINGVQYLVTPYSKNHSASTTSYNSFPAFTLPLDYPGDYVSGISKSIFNTRSTTVTTAANILVEEFQDIACRKGFNPIYFRSLSPSAATVDYGLLYFVVQLPKDTTLEIEGLYKSGEAYPFTLTINIDENPHFVVTGDDYAINPKVSNQAFYANEFVYEVESELEGCPVCETDMYKLTNCSSYEVILTDEDLSEYVGTTIIFEGNEDCWEVEETQNQNITVTDNFRNCKFCLPKCPKPECK